VTERALANRATIARPAWATRSLRSLMLATDVGFVLYWSITATHLLPSAWLFKNYASATMQAWNWSFLPLDLVVSATGLAALWRLSRNHPSAAPLALISLASTSASGLMAISFWALNSDFALGWWTPNLFLLLYPLPFLRAIASASRS